MRALTTHPHTHSSAQQFNQTIYVYMEKSSFVRYINFTKSAISRRLTLLPGIESRTTREIVGRETVHCGVTLKITENVICIFHENERRSERRERERFKFKYFISLYFIIIINNSIIRVVLEHLRNKLYLLRFIISLMLHWATLFFFACFMKVFLSSCLKLCFSSWFFLLSYVCCSQSLWKIL